MITSIRRNYDTNALFEFSARTSLQQGIENGRKLAIKKLVATYELMLSSCSRNNSAVLTHTNSISKFITIHALDVLATSINSVIELQVCLMVEVYVDHHCLV